MGVAEVSEIVQHSVAHGVGAVMEALPERADEAVVLVFVAGGIGGFGDAVGVEDEALSFARSVLGYGVLGPGEEAERQAVRVETLGCMMEKEEGRAVSGVADLETVGSGSAADESGVVGWAGALAEEAVGA